MRCNFFLLGDGAVLPPDVNHHQGSDYEQDIAGEVLRLEAADHGDIAETKQQSLLNEPVPDNIATLDWSSNLFHHIHLSSTMCGTSFEGLDPKIAVSYLYHHLSNIFGSDHLSKYQPVHDAIQSLHQFCQRLEDNVFNKILVSPSKRKVTQLVKKFADAEAEKVYQLKPGENYFMTGGWVGRPDGHAMYYQFHRNEDKTYDIYRYEVNKSYGRSLDDKKSKGLVCLYMKNVPASEILFVKDDSETWDSAFFEQLLLLNVLPIYFSESNPDYEFRQSHVDICFEHLNGYVTALPGHLTYYMTEQRAGRCATRSLDALLVTVILQTAKKVSSKPVGIEFYKFIQAESKLVSLRAYYQHYKACLRMGPKNCLFLRLAAESMCRLYCKKSNDDHSNEFLSDQRLRELLYTAQDLMLSLDEVEKERETSQATRLKKALPFENDKSPFTYHGVPFYERRLSKGLQSKQNCVDISTVSRASIYKPKPKDLSAYLSDQVQIFEEFVANQTLEDVLIYIQVLVDCIPVPLDEDDYWSGIPSKDIDDVRESFEKISDVYSKAVLSTKKRSHLEVHNTNMALIVFLL